MAESDTRPRHVYRGQELRCCAMPLGGIGTGNISLCGDGSLRQWEIHNESNHLGCIPNSFFAFWTRRARPDEIEVHPPMTINARVLQSSALYNSEGIKPPPTSNDHFVPLAHRQLLKRLPGIESTEFAGEYPIAHVEYHDGAFPLTVMLDGFSPFIPLNSKDSGLPAIIFNFTVTNPTTGAHHAALAGSLQNAVGWDNVAPIFDTRCPLYGGNLNTVTRLGEMTALNMISTRLTEDHPAFGSMNLAVLAPDATYLTQWTDLDTFWADFADDGRLSNTADAAPSTPGRTWNGALATRFVLAPGETRRITFLISWYFPNRYLNYSQRELFNFDDEKTRFWVGNQYNNWFRSALDVSEYVRTNLTRLVQETELARDTLYDTTLPHPLIDAVTSQASIVRSPTYFWDDKGFLYGFEGCYGASNPFRDGHGGCCPLNCTHVFNYEMAMARLYPTLERTMRTIDWDYQQHPSGSLPFRVLYPLYLPRPWNEMVDGLPPAMDGMLGGILKTYREYRAYGDDAWLAHHWDSLRRVLQHLWTEHDPDKTGVIEGQQGNTYDISIYGANTFIGTLYLASLRAMAEMAERRGEAEFAQECRAVYERGRADIERRLWNGEYYIQDVDFDKHPEQNWGKGCHIDQLLGQWWAYQLGLGAVLDPERVRSATRSIVQYNFRENFRGLVQQPRVYCMDDDQGLLICTWPHGGRPPVPTLYSDEVWTGLEYEVAALLLFQGEAELALQVVQATRMRYDGRKQNPWNDVECGDHYARATASWSLLDAAAGYDYDASRAHIGFSPNITPDEFRAPFVARDGWGTFVQRKGADEQIEHITPWYGTLSISTLQFRTGHPLDEVTIQLDSQPLASTFVRSGDRVDITLSEAVTINTGQTLLVTLA